MMSYLLLILACHSFFGSSQYNVRVPCPPQHVTAECGTQVDLLCTPTSLSGKLLKNTSIVQLVSQNKNQCRIEGVGTSISQNGRLQCFVKEWKAGLQLRTSRITDAGYYKFFFDAEDSNKIYYADLKITGTTKTPNMSLILDNKTVVCKVEGGCPVGQIEWSDNFGTNWTKSATIKEEDSLIVSTLHLSLLSTMEEYYCTVSYQLMGNTETQTNCISMKSLTGCNSPKSIISDSKDPETVNSVPILVPIFIIICVILGVVWIMRHRFRGQRQRLVPVGVKGQRQPLVPVGVKGFECLYQKKTANKKDIQPSLFKATS